MKKLLALTLTALLFNVAGWSGEGNRFVLAQLQYDGAWDPYPEVHESVFEMVKGITNIPFTPQRRVVKLSDAQLFEYPFLLIKGNAAFKPNEADRGALKRYIDGGGFVFVDDTLANSKGPFAASIKQLFSELYPDRPFHKLPSDHALYRAFFLLRGVAGRRIAEKYLEGMDVGGHIGGEGRTAVIYCPNDLMGAWMRDRLGQYTFTCEPGGEPQRWEAFKLTINVIYFSLTGTYKKDAIHQPFIERKLEQ